MAKDPKDSKIMEYKDTISQLNMTIKSQNELIVCLRQTIDANNAMMNMLNEKVDYLTKKLFGTSSEKSKNVEGQLSLFNEAEQEAGFLREAEAEETVVREHIRKAKGTQAELFKGVPVKDEVIPLSEDQKHCGDCGAQLEVIGREFVRQEFRFTPAKGEVVNIYRETAKCPACSQTPAMEKAVSFVKAYVPEALIHPQLCIRIRRGMDNVPEICKRHALIQTGAGLEADGRYLKQGDTRQLDTVLCRELFFSAV